MKVQLRDGTSLGYVPRPYTELVSTWLAEGRDLVATIERQLVLPEQYGRWVARLEERGRSS